MIVNSNIVPLSDYLSYNWLEKPNSTADIVRLPTLDQIKQKLDTYESTYEVRRERSFPFPMNLDRHIKYDDPNVFIFTKTNSAFSLKPNITNKHFLFRGEKKLYPNCLPLARRERNFNHLLENIKRSEFEMVLNSHPLFYLLMKGIKLDNLCAPFKLLNPYGIAQHYGFKTVLLDLTSDFDVASFFATTNYEQENDVYKPYIQPDSYGVIYIYHMLLPFVLLTRELSTVGLQPFPRSGNQKGFLWLPLFGDNYDLQNNQFVTKIFFKHDDLVTYKIFNRMQKGVYLFPEADELATKASQILQSKSFSKDAFKHNLRENPQDTYDKNIKKIELSGYAVDNNQKPLSFTYDDLDDYYRRIKNGWWEEFCNKIYIPNFFKKSLKDELLNVVNKVEYRRYFYRD